MRFKLSVFVCLFALAPVALSQEFRASISGHILDSTGARVPQAKVVATNVASGETSSAQSDNSGSYTIPLLPPGQYKLVVTAPGFKQYVRENITLTISQAAGVDGRSLGAKSGGFPTPLEIA